MLKIGNLGKKLMKELAVTETRNKALARRVNWDKRTLDPFNKGNLIGTLNKPSKLKKIKEMLVGYGKLRSK